MLIITLNIKPYSLNKYFYGNRAIKRQETVMWENSVLEQLRNSKVQEDIESFRNLFNSKKNYIKVSILTEFPKDILFNKQGKLSSRAFDLSNIEKPLIDVLFLEKYSTSVTKNIEIDDKYICELISKKIPAEYYKITITIQLEDLQNL